MSRETLNLDSALYEYLLAVTDREPDLLRELRQETATLSSARMQIGPDQGQFMALLVKLMGARKTLEVGTYTGYSALAVGLALPADGRVVCCDVSREWTDIARRYWRRSGIEERFELHLRPALETLDELQEKGENGSYDFAFIDADKENYPEYFERSLRLLRPGGLIAVDNVLWGGSVIDPDNLDEDTAAIRRFNRDRHGDERIDLAMVPVGDGLTLALKR